MTVNELMWELQPKECPEDGRRDVVVSITDCRLGPKCFQPHRVTNVTADERGRVVIQGVCSPPARPSDLAAPSAPRATTW